MKDWVVVFATLVAPLLAVQTQKYLERLRESRVRKDSLFQTLMATRTNRLSFEHVRALNLIDIEFHNTGGLLNKNKYRQVIEAWKNYHDHLHNVSSNTENWNDEGDKLLVEMLYQMSAVLGYDFDRVVIKRRGYTPRGHGDQAIEEQTIRHGLAKILSNQESLNVYLVNMDETAIDESQT